jgi:hypothetical protein
LEFLALEGSDVNFFTPDNHPKSSDVNSGKPQIKKAGVLSLLFPKSIPKKP